MSRNFTRANLLEFVTSVVGAGTEEGSSDVIHPGWRRLQYYKGSTEQLFGGQMPTSPVLTKRWPGNCFSSRLRTLADRPNLTRDEFINSGLVTVDKVKEGASIGEAFIGSSTSHVTVSPEDVVPRLFPGQVTASRAALVTDVPWLSFLHVEMGGNAVVSILFRGTKVWIVCNSITATRKYDRILRDPGQFLQLLMRKLHQGEADALSLVAQRPGDCVILPHLFGHAVLTIKTGLSIPLG